MTNRIFHILFRCCVSIAGSNLEFSLIYLSNRAFDFIVKASITEIIRNIETENLQNTEQENIAMTVKYVNKVETYHFILANNFLSS